MDDPAPSDPKPGKTPRKSRAKKVPVKPPVLGVIEAMNSPGDEPDASGRTPQMAEVEDGGNEGDRHDANARTTQTETTVEEGKEGDNRLSSAGPVPPTGGQDAETGPVACAIPGESRALCWERLRREGRMAGLPKGQGPGSAYQWATREVERLFSLPAEDPEAIEPEVIEPPPEPVASLSPIGDTPEPPPPEAAPPAPPVDTGVSGLGEMPPNWPTLPANAQLQVEIAWVSANRLRVRSGHGVDLSRALSPAPSYSALSWLETSILFPSKFADISVKATANQDDEREGIRREKLAIEEIRGLLAEMLEG